MGSGTVTKCPCTHGGSKDKLPTHGERSCREISRPKRSENLGADKHLELAFERAACDHTFLCRAPRCREKERRREEAVRDVVWSVPRSPNAKCLLHLGFLVFCHTCHAEATRPACAGGTGAHACRSIYPGSIGVRAHHRVGFWSACAAPRLQQPRVSLFSATCSHTKKVVGSGQCSGARAPPWAKLAAAPLP